MRICGHTAPGPDWCRICFPQPSSEADLGKDRAASLPLGEVMDLVGHVVSGVSSLRRLIAPPVDAPKSREPAAATAPRPAATEAADTPVASPLVTRVLVALMDMPDAEFLTLANKILNRYYAAVSALAPEGIVVQVACIHCEAIQTHRVCAECFMDDKHKT